MKKHLIVPLYGFINWGGGRDFISYVLYHLNKSNQVCITCAVPNDVFFLDRIAYIIPNIGFGKKLKDYSKRRKYALEIARKFDCRTIEVRRKHFENFVNAGNYDLVYASFYGFKGVSIPVVGYIYDFQHKHMPKYFSSDEIKRRDEAFCEIVENCQGVLVNSYKVKKDVQKFQGIKSDKVFVFPYSLYDDVFNAYGLTRVLNDRLLRVKYNIKCGKYILCSNENFAHKNLNFLRNAFLEMRMEDVALLFTGKRTDSLGSGNLVMGLGFISKEDQINLMNFSVGVIQPSSYEGGPGGGSILEALSLGKPVLMSDIEINREIQCANTIYFKEMDKYDLMDGITRLLDSSNVSKKGQKNGTKDVINHLNEIC